VLIPLSRLAYKTLKLIISPLAGLNSSLYMKFYLRVLRGCGMNLPGRPSYIAPSAWFDQLGRITLGERVVISRDVRFLTHDYSNFTAEIALGCPPPKGFLRSGTITLADNVFVGLGSIVLPNTTIGANTIIGAGSVVRGKIAGGSVFMGNPAKFLMPIEEYVRITRANSSSWALEADHTWVASAPGILAATATTGSITGRKPE
jgi:acetyltransferase-like isoleucine patch superfamily enzyme